MLSSVLPSVLYTGTVETGSSAAQNPTGNRNLRPLEEESMGDPEDQTQTGLDRMDPHAAFERLTSQRSEAITKSTGTVSFSVRSTLFYNQPLPDADGDVICGLICLPGHNPNTGILRRCEQRQSESNFFFNCISPSLLRRTRATAAG